MSLDHITAKAQQFFAELAQRIEARSEISAADMLTLLVAGLFPLQDQHIFRARNGALSFQVSGSVDQIKQILSAHIQGWQADSIKLVGSKLVEVSGLVTGGFTPQGYHVAGQFLHQPRTDLHMLRAKQSIVARELSELQQAYQDFFREKLAEYEAVSPADLTDEQKSEFFTNIKDTWPARRAEVENGLSAFVGLSAMHRDGNNYLLKLTANSMPTRNEIVAWCRGNGLSIDPANIRIRGSVLRVQAVDGGMNVKPAAGLMAALQDQSPEALLAEVGDEINYVSAGVRCTGHVKAYCDDGLVVANCVTSEQDIVAIHAVLQVRGYHVEAARAATPEQIVAAQFQL